MTSNASCKSKISLWPSSRSSEISSAPCRIRISWSRSRTNTVGKLLLTSVPLSAAVPRFLARTSVHGPNELRLKYRIYWIYFCSGLAANNCNGIWFRNRRPRDCSIDERFSGSNGWTITDDRAKEYSREHFSYSTTRRQRNPSHRNGLLGDRRPFLVRYPAAWLGRSGR